MNGIGRSDAAKYLVTLDLMLQSIADYGVPYGNSGGLSDSK
jgi:hypothetical protein